MPDISIKPLAEHSDHIELCAAWIYGEWGCLIPDRTLQYYIDLYQEYATSGGIPNCVIAFVDGHVVGTATIRDHDLADQYCDYKPWMTMVYVHPTFRNIGVGETLVTAIEEHAQKEHVETLYLYTSHASKLYRKLDWQDCETIDNPIHDNDANTSIIMKKVF